TLTNIGGYTLKASEFNSKKMYSEASGSVSVVDRNIKMELNEYGLYKETIVDSEKELNNLVPMVSPNLNNHTSETEIANYLYSNIDNINFDKRIGYYSSLYVGYVKEGEYREHASSGGMGTWIFKELFDRDMI